MKKLILSIVLLVSISIKGQKIELIESFIGYTQKSEIISFTPNPKLIMSGDYQGNINLWNLERQELIKTKNLRPKNRQSCLDLANGPASI